MADHQRIFGGINFLHCGYPKAPLTSNCSISIGLMTPTHAGERSRSTLISRRAKESVPNDLHSRPRLTDGREPTNLHGGASATVRPCQTHPEQKPLDTSL